MRDLNKINQAYADWQSGPHSRPRTSFEAFEAGWAAALKSLLPTVDSIVKSIEACQKTNEELGKILKGNSA